MFENKIIIEFDDGFTTGKLGAVKEIMIFDNIEQAKRFLLKYFDKVNISAYENYIDCFYNNIFYTATIKEAFKIKELNND